MAVTCRQCQAGAGQGGIGAASSQFTLWWQQGLSWVPWDKHKHMNAEELPWCSCREGDKKGRGRQRLCRGLRRGCSRSWEQIPKLLHPLAVTFPSPVPAQGTG